MIDPKSPVLMALFFFFFMGPPWIVFALFSLTLAAGLRIVEVFRLRSPTAEAPDLKSV